MPKAKGLKLKDALTRQKGTDTKKEHQKQLQKNAEKRKRSKVEDENDDEKLQSIIAQAENALAKESKSVPSSKPTKRRKTSPEDDENMDGESAGSEGWETEDSEDDEEDEEIDLGRLEDSDTSDSELEDDEVEAAEAGMLNGVEDDEEDEEEDDEDIPLSDIESLASDDKGDIVPHQRLTINNHAALLRAHKSIALSSSLPFSATQSVTSAEPTQIADIEDDLQRELAFYKQSLDAVTRARPLLKAEGIPFSRPADYFAEMVKSDEHMSKIKKKLVDEAASKKAASEARRQRDLKKFGKQVQIAKLQERDKAKRDTMDKINLLKRKRQGADISNANEDDMFDVALEDAAETDRKDRAERKARGSGAGKPNAKRQKRDEKYGFGGKKRFKKSNDAQSSADTRGFSVKKMKGGKTQRPGKSRRARM